jgi:hypothetical protein
MRRLTAVVVLAAFLALPAGAMAGHGLRLDHPSRPFTTTSPPPAMRTISEGPAGKWSFVASFPTGNPQTDIDFFTQGGSTFVSAGTLAIGPNAGGQTIYQLTAGDQVAPKFVSSFPSASCLSEPSQALGLQHDVEATPKGGAILNTDVLAAARDDTQLLIDATDNPGRCHDQGSVFGFARAPQGGLEIIDVTDVRNPVAIGLTSHIGEAHTVNVDPKRPHIAYAVTSDAVTTDAAGSRSNENLTDAEGQPNADRLDLDGFEVVDLSSCMYFASGTSLQEKRDRCRPVVYRYRYPSVEMSLGHTNTTGANGVFGCHELEVYPDDRLMCAGGNAMIAFDMRGAFDDGGTPGNFRDDHPRGTPLPCSVRDSSSNPPFKTGAKVVDCVDGQGSGTEDLNVPNWLAAGAPSLEGVGWLGSAFHPGRESTTGAASPRFDSTEDIDFDHEAELSASGDFVLATDERGGGVTPPGASCSPSTDIKSGNGGIHAYRFDRLLKGRPLSPEDAHASYARNSKSEKAIYRARVRTGPQDSLCTAHVFQQIPGQNRIFMGWYSQGTQVVDFHEHDNGRLDFEEAGWWIPQNADEWVSHIFRVDLNEDGTFTYWGTAADFNLGNAGRNAVEVYKTTLPPPPAPRRLMAGVGKGFAPAACLAQRARVRSRGIGRLRLGHRPARVVKSAGEPVRKKGRVYRYCVMGRRKSDRVLAVFARRGGLRLIATSARGHSARGVRPGSRVSKLRRAYRDARKAARGTYFTSKSTRVVFGTRRGRVSFIAVVDRRLVKNARLLRAYLRQARLR